MSPVPNILVRDVELFVLPTVTRFPFRYGIAAMTEAPHLFVRSRLEIDGREAEGIASEGLPPKWFTKNPRTTFEDDDLPGMLSVIRHATGQSQQIGEPLSFFDLWRTVKQQQDEWAAANATPTLLSQLGTALLERTVLDGLCRFLKTPCHQVVRENQLGVRLGEIHRELDGQALEEVFAAPPLESVAVRHTIGLADPLTDAEILPGDRTDDGLPHSLRSNIREYGLTHFKVKLFGDLDQDRERLRDVASLLEAEAPAGFRITVDGNEQYRSIEQFREHFAAHQADPGIARLLDRLLFVEQPLHRDVALDDSVRQGFAAWSDGPSVIIDESDGDLADLPRALEIGYSGTSHKNCKGILKSLANAALIKRRGGVMSAEDLANIGPVAMLQDLALVALLRIPHAERNGHHYFAGLSMYPESIQQAVLVEHDDLYERGQQGFAVLRVQEGEVSTSSINRAPFGVGLGWQQLGALKEGASKLDDG